MANRYSIPIPPFTIAERVPGKEGWVEPDIRHAQKFGLYPHVTNCLDFGDEGLTQHKIGRAVFFAACHPYAGKSHPDTHELDPEDYKEYMAHVLGMASKELGEYSDAGKELHAKVAQFYEGKGYPQDHEGAQQVIATLAPRLKALGVVRVVCEKKLVDHVVGFVGTPDLVGETATGEVVWMGDMKQVNEGPFAKRKTSKSLYQKWRAQLAAYSLLREVSGIEVDQVLSNRQTGECKLVAHDNHDTMIEATRLHIMGYCLRNYGYLPGPDAMARKNELTKVWNEIYNYNKGLIPA